MSEPIKPGQQQYTQCPKCGHAPLPQDQALPAACPACGLVLAKFGMRLALPIAAQSADHWDGKGNMNDRDEGDERDDSDSWRVRFTALVTHVPSQVDAVTFWARVVMLVVFTFWGLRLIALDFRTGGMVGGGSFLHGPLLIFHEAGHVIFRLLGEFMMIAGGSLGQLIMPAILCGALLITNRDPFGAAIGLWLFGASLLDLAPYIYDSLHPQLILLGGHTGEDGGHDWIYLLDKMGLLKHSQGLGWFVHKLGALVMLLAIGWGAWLLWRSWCIQQQRKRLGLAEGAGLNEGDEL